MNVDVNFFYLSAYVTRTKAGPGPPNLGPIGVCLQ